jgi:hypothetical protein
MFPETLAFGLHVYVSEEVDVRTIKRSSNFGIFIACGCLGFVMIVMPSHQPNSHTFTPLSITCTPVLGNGTQKSLNIDLVERILCRNITNLTIEPYVLLSHSVRSDRQNSSIV